MNIFSKLTKKEAKLGTITTSIFAYITPLMIVIALVVSVIVAFAFNTLFLYFQTNVPLNGLIIFLLFISLFQAFKNNFDLYKTSLLLKQMERLSEQDAVTDAELQKLHHSLENEAKILNTKPMQQNITNIGIFGHPNFSDSDARIIKSKLGYRMSLKKSSVGFNAGILVMLGLLGTFLGLLKTIDAVGDAMAGMSSIGGDGGEINTDTMSTFITSLSAPLQGMGLAFSSSLFGLSGSLLIGFFNNLCGGAQNNFIEDVSRWIDNRIPQFHPEKKKGDNTNAPASQDDLKTWLAGFVNLSVKTNKQISNLSQALLLSLKQSEGMNESLERIAHGQEHMSAQYEQTSNSLQTLSAQNTSLVEAAQNASAATYEFKNMSAQHLTALNDQVKLLSQTFQDGLGQSIAASHSVSENMMDQLEGIKETISHQGDLTGIKAQIQSVESALVTASNNQAQMVQQTMQAQAVNQPESIDYTMQFKAIAALLEDLNNKQQAALEKLSAPIVPPLSSQSDNNPHLSELSADLQKLSESLDNDGDASALKNFLGLDPNQENK